MIRAEGHAIEGTSSVSSLLTRNNRLTTAIHVIISATEEHGHIIRFARGGVNAVSVARIRRCCNARSYVAGSYGVFADREVGW